MKSESQNGTSKKKSTRHEVETTEMLAEQPPPAGPTTPATRAKPPAGTETPAARPPLHGCLFDVEVRPAGCDCGDDDGLGGEDVGQFGDSTADPPPFEAESVFGEDASPTESGCGCVPAVERGSPRCGQSRREDAPRPHPLGEADEDCPCECGDEEGE